MKPSFFAFFVFLSVLVASWHFSTYFSATETRKHKEFTKFLKSASHNGLFLVIINLFAHVQTGERVLFTINDKKITSDEFKYVYLKNNPGNETISREKAIKEYLDLYVNFKLKVQEAYDLGLDTTRAFLNEFNMYRDQLAEPYLKEKEVSDQLLREAYSRLEEEVNVSHILVRLNDPLDEDTIRAYERITNIYNRAISGEDFVKLALEYSEDPSVSQNEGNLGYFTALQMIYPFENAAYHTPVGEISKPFRTRFGYHILKAQDRRPSKGEVEVAHIMISFPQNMTNEEQIELHKKAVDIYESLLDGADWDQTCANFSEDYNTRNTGGVLNPFRYGRMIPSFADVAFSLEQPGDFSPPVRTPYGWHIIKLIRKIPLGEYDEIEYKLQEQISRDSRSELSKKALINRLKTENDFHENENMINQVVIDIRQALDAGTFKADTVYAYTDSILFTIKDYLYSYKDFLRYVASRNPGNAKQSEQRIRQWMNEFIEKELIHYEKSHLEEKYYDFRMLVNEYREGILLFERMEEKVWNKAVKDSTGLMVFFNDHRDRYRWGERVHAYIFRSTDRKILDSVRIYLKEDFYPVNDIMYVFNDPEDMDIYNLVDSIAANHKNDTTIYLRLNTNPDYRSIIQQKLADTSLLSNTCLQFIKWENSENDNIRIQVVSTSKKHLETIFNQNSTLNLQIESGFYERGDNEIIDRIDWSPGLYELSIEDQEYLVEVMSIIPAGLKQINETRGKVISDYQEYLESDWIRELKQKYNVEISKKELKRVIKEFEQN